MVLKLNLSAEVESDFREMAMKTYGYKKGSISKALEKALFDWTIHQKAFAKELKEIGDPIDAIEGMLSDVKMTSVELQHKMVEMWGDEYVDD